MNEIDDAFDLPIVRDFDKICFEFGDRDAILMHGRSTPISYFEIQEHAKMLSFQLYHRFGWPDYILVDCQGSPAAEAVATLACMRLRRPFVPVSGMDQHRSDRMTNVVRLLSTKGKQYMRREFERSTETNESNSSHSPSIAAIVVCENDGDPLLSVFRHAGVHRILQIDSTGGLRDCVSVPETFRFQDTDRPSCQDDIYVMFTSGTTTDTESASALSAKAVVGSHRATHARLRWFLKTFQSSPRIGRRTKLTFVDGVTELWGGLLDPMNAIVCVPPKQLQARGVIALVEDMECTQLLLLPSQASQLLLASSKCNSFLNLDRIIVSGEVCSAMLWSQLKIRCPKTQVINLYGQTETTGDCLCAVLTDLGEAAVVDNIVAVGKPISTGFHISVTRNVGDDYDYSNKQNLRECKNIQHQQLLIQGSHLSNGYLGSSSTFDQFRPGDVGFHRNGFWYVYGRTDEVRKINGVLTSSSEVESVFCKTYHIGTGVVAVMVENKSYLLCTNEDIVNQFSRTHMHNEKKIPLNLIPAEVLLVPSIPQGTSGARKIDRKACRKLVEKHCQQCKDKVSQFETKGQKRSDKRTVVSIAAAVLGIEECDVDNNASFLEMGGDSASSITLLYQLKQEIGHIADITAIDILWCESLNELENLIAGRIKRPKRLKNEKVTPLLTAAETFVPDRALQVDRWHRSISFSACVDCTPIIIGDSIISACQGGVIIKFGSIDGCIKGHYHYHGWKFQADLVLLEASKKILVCGYSTMNKGILICLTSDLGKEEWKLELDDSIKSRPVIIQDEVWVLSGRRVVGIDLQSGNLLNKEIQLPRWPCASNPFIIRKDNSQTSIGFASSNWEGGIMVVDLQKMEVEIFVDGEIGPVHKHITSTENSEELIICDAYGSIHVLAVDEMKIMASIQLSSNPLTTTTMIDKNKIIVGSYNGKLYCVKYDQKLRQLEKCWECDCYSSIYSKPLKLCDGSVIVCTTAGNFLRISTQEGEIQSSYKISAEIWSSPAQIGESNIIVVGARDSQCHIVSRFE